MPFKHTSLIIILPLGVASLFTLLIIRSLHGFEDRYIFPVDFFVLHTQLIKLLKKATSNLLVQSLQAFRALSSCAMNLCTGV